MDERFKGKGVWVAAGLLAVVFLCLMLCGLGAMVTSLFGSGRAYGPVPQASAPSGGEGAIAPQAYYGPLGVAHPFGMASFGLGMLFRMLFFGLILVLLIGLIRRLFWGPRHWYPGYHRPYYPGKPPKGEPGEGHPHPGWGPWARHWHEHWSEGRDPIGEESQPGDPDLAQEGTE
jgi:hypothetical protein